MISPIHSQNNYATSRDLYMADEPMSLIDGIFHGSPHSATMMALGKGYFASDQNAQLRCKRGLTKVQFSSSVVIWIKPLSHFCSKKAKMYLF